MMMADAKLLAGDVDAFGRIEIGGEDAEVNVGHKGAEQQHAVALLDELSHFRVPHRPLVQADIKRMLLRDDAFSQERRRHRNAELLRQVNDLVLQTEAMDLHAGNDYRPL